MKKLFLILMLVFAKPLMSFAYTDVPESNSYKQAIDYMSEKGVVKGYSDETYRPNKLINRAEFTKIIVEAKLKMDPKESAANCFSDVQSDVWFSSYVCHAKDKNWIGGYSDGNFLPNNDINVVEASKILVNVLGVSTLPAVGSEWYHVYVEAMDNQNYFPLSIASYNQKVTRGEMTEMVWRILEKKIDQPSSSVVQLENACLPLGQDIPGDIDIDMVRATWLKWFNEIRATENLPSYTYNDQLNRTATVWSEVAKKRGYMDHRREKGDEYYDYWKITDWFKDLGLEFENVNRVTHSENIGWGVYQCNDSECTDELIEAIRLTFDFYVAEKNKEYKPHYESLMNLYFKEVGLGISIDKETRKYYLTVHYGTQITSSPDEVCKE